MTQKSILRALMIGIFIILGLSSCSSQDGWQKKAIDRYIKQTTSDTESETAQLPQSAATTSPVTAQNTKKIIGSSTINVALFLPLTGQYAEMGQGLFNAAQQALFDSGNNQISLIPFDTKSTESGTQAAVTLAKSEKIDIILGPFLSTDTAYVKKAYRGSAIPIISFSNAPNLGGDNVFMMGFSPLEQTKSVLEFASNKNTHNIGVIVDNNEHGQLIESLIQGLAPQYNLNIMNKAYVKGQSGAPLQQQLSAFMGLGGTKQPYQAIFIGTNAPDSVAISQILVNNGYGTQAVARLGTGLWDDEILATHPAMQNSFFASADPVERHAFEQDYFKLFKTPAPRLASLAYDGVSLISVLSANNQNKSINIRDLRNPNGFAGIDGVFRFGNDNIIQRNLAILGIQDKQQKLIQPAKKNFRE
jgi:branched-chain amino acid transport system substrate-binding protein